MEYVVGVLFGVAVLVGLPLFRRRSRLSTPRPHLSFHPHTDEAGNLMCFALSLERPYTDRSSPPDA